MTRRELVKAAIAHKETERVPYCIGFTGGGEKRLQEAIGRQTAQEYVDNDVVRVSVPWWTWHELGPEWRAADPPSTPATVIGIGSYTQFFESLRLLRDNSDKYILAMIYGSHFEKAYFTRGIENFLADMAGYPEFARKLLNRIIDKNMVMLENFLMAPEIDGVLLGSDWGSQVDLLMSPDTWQEMIRDGEQKEYDLVHSYGKDVWVHSCGCVERIIPSLVEMGLDVLNPVQPECMDLAKLKRDFGDKLAFWGGISTQQVLPFGTPDEVKAEVRRVRRLMATGGGYILAPAQEIQEDVPAENIIALVEAAREPGL
ncbi:MAG: methylcobalamin:coenzyme M methyltransferase [Candidatus Latescibacteria bacterium ADurb.Bin168]|nr:MAG: methylcobalamin:coenzyme M methyltransferase [Candidatus Latescibacteria bacterium ADurb.Bin168]